MVDVEVIKAINEIATLANLALGDYIHKLDEKKLDEHEKKEQVPF